MHGHNGLAWRVVLVYEMVLCPCICVLWRRARASVVGRVDFLSLTRIARARATSRRAPTSSRAAARDRGDAATGYFRIDSTMPMRGVGGGRGHRARGGHRHAHATRGRASASASASSSSCDGVDSLTCARVLRALVRDARDDAPCVDALARLLATAVNDRRGHHHHHREHHHRDDIQGDGWDSIAAFVDDACERRSASAPIASIECAIAQCDASHDWRDEDACEIRAVALDVLERMKRDGGGGRAEDEAFARTLGVGASKVGKKSLQVRDTDDTDDADDADDADGEGSRDQASVVAMRTLYRYSKSARTLTYDPSLAPSSARRRSCVRAGFDALVRYVMKVTRDIDAKDPCPALRHAPQVLAPPPPPSSAPSAKKSSTASVVTFVYEDGAIDEATRSYDLSRVRALESTADAHVHRCVKSWMSDHRDCDAMRAALDELVPDAAPHVSVAHVQRRELVNRALTSWCDLRAALAAVEIGHEEFALIDARAKFFMHRNDTLYRTICKAEDCETMSAMYASEIEDARVALAQTTPRSGDIARARDACISAVRAANACDDARGRRRVNAGYVAPNDDVKTTLSDALRDLKDAFDDIVRDVYETTSVNDDDADLSRGAEHAAKEALMRAMVDVSDVALERFHPLLHRYAGSKLEGVYDRVIRALNREGSTYARAVELCMCATYARAFADAATAHAKRVDDEVLARALEELCDDDGVARRSRQSAASGGQTTMATIPTARRSRRQRKMNASTSPSMSREPKHAGHNDEDEDVDKNHCDARDDDGDDCGGHVIADDDNDIAIDVFEATSATTEAFGGEGWTTARPRRKTAAGAQSRVIAPPLPPMPPPMPPPQTMPVSAFVPPLPAAGMPTVAKSSITIPAPRSMTPSVDSRKDFPPKPKVVATTNMTNMTSTPTVVSSSSSSSSSVSSSSSLRSIAEYQKMLDTESAIERERRLEEFPALTSNAASTDLGAVSTVSSAAAEVCPRVKPVPSPRLSPPMPPVPPPPVPVPARRLSSPPSKTWAEAKRAIDGIKLPSLIKIN